MNEFAIARALHVVAVVMWIGGVAMVTTVLLPATKQHVPAADRVAFFERVSRASPPRRAGRPRSPA